MKCAASAGGTFNHFIVGQSAVNTRPRPGTRSPKGHCGEKRARGRPDPRPDSCARVPPYCTLETLRYDISFCGGPFPEFHRVKRADRRPDWPSDETMGDSAGRTRPSTMLR